MSFEERKHIGYMYNKENKGTLREMGEEMKRSHNTIGIEIKAGLVDGIYEPDIGEKKAKLLRKRSKPTPNRIRLRTGFYPVNIIIRICK